MRMYRLPLRKPSSGSVTFPATCFVLQAVLNGFLLLSVDPGGQNHEEELPGSEDEIHGPAITGKCVATAFTSQCSIW